MARGPALRCRALVLDRTKLGETDLILTMLAESGAELRAVAKGARRPGSRMAGRTELYSEIDALLAPGRSLYTLGEARLVRAPQRGRTQIEATAALAAMAELARLSALPDIEDPYVFALCRRAFASVEEAADEDHLMLAAAAFALKLLSHQGWRPELAQCVVCGSGDVVAVSAEAGGVLCTDHAAEAESEPLDGRQRAWLEALIGVPFDGILAAEVDDAMAGWLLDFAVRWARCQLDVHLRALDLLESLLRS